MPILIFIFKTSTASADADNYLTTKAHVSVLDEARNRKRAIYDSALAAWNEFKVKAVRWTEISNKINRTEEEKSIKTEVFSNFNLKNFLFEIKPFRSRMRYPLMKSPLIYRATPSGALPIRLKAINLFWKKIIKPNPTAGVRP